MTTYDQLLLKARLWAERAQCEQWLSAEAVKTLMELDQRSPASLFAGDIDRPLVAAFFGGTGVGKSTLLNRLAGQAVARTGIERPTSREISLYLHDSIQHLNLPEVCPLEQVRKATHHNDARRHVLWVDMPDIDSIEESNRDLVLAWLPHVDVVIYVVNPERYRDDQGWELLRSHGTRHAWLFVINQWDKGYEVQYQDFQQLLIRAGFTDPIILRTDSRDQDETRKADDFERLQHLLDEMTDRHILSQLESRADNLRLDALAQCMGTILDKLGDDEGYQGLQTFFSRHWVMTRRSIMEGLEWPLRNVAREFVGRDASPLRRRLQLLPTRKPEATEVRPSTAVVLWDDWADSQFRDVLDQLIVEAGRRELALPPLKTALEDHLSRVERTVVGEAQAGLRKALIKPGHAFQRFLLGIAGVMTIALPLAALGWVSFQVVEGYYQSTQHQMAWLGTDFAVHSGFLIVLAWLLPFFLYRALTPSAERSAIRGLRVGIDAAMNTLELNVLDVLSDLEHNRHTLLDEGRHLLRQVGTEKIPEVSGDSALLGRVLSGKTDIPHG